MKRNETNAVETFSPDARPVYNGGTCIGGNRMSGARFVSIALVLLTAKLASAQEKNAGAHDWPKFLGPFGTSVSAEKGIITPWPKAGLKVVWHKKLGTGYGPPVISRGKVFVFDRHEGN